MERGKATIAVTATSIALLLVLSGCSNDGQQVDPPASNSQSTATTGSEATNESDADVLLTAALQAHVEGRYEDARVMYEAALAQDPENKYAHFNLGLLSQTAGALEAAITSYERALQVDPSYVPALFNLGIAQTSAGDVAAAIDSYRQVVAVDDSYAEAHLNLGVLLLQSGSEDDGLAEINRAYELDPSVVVEDPITE